MSELEKREKEIIKEANEYINQVRDTNTSESALYRFFVNKIAELQLKIEALEATKISGDTRIGGQPKPEQNGF